MVSGFLVKGKGGFSHINFTMLFLFHRKLLLQLGVVFLDKGDKF